MFIAVINVQRIFAESKPSDAARSHMVEVRDALRKGLDELIEFYKGRVAAPNAQKSIAESRDNLQKQMDTEQKTVDAVIRNMLIKAIDTWRATHENVDMIISRDQIIFCKADFDITEEIMAILNDMTPTFAPLPTVQIKKK